MSWLIAGLVGLVLLVGLVVTARRRGGHHRGADDTLVSELLGPREVAEVPAPQAGAVPIPQAGEEAARPAVSHPAKEPVPQPAIEVESAPAPPGPAAEGDWLESQLAWITAWSQRMHRQIESAGQPGTDRTE